MTTLMECNRQWSTRPDDERFVSIDAMLAHYQHERDHSRAVVIDTGRIEAQPAAAGTTIDHKGLQIVGPSGTPYVPTNWAFRQLCQLASGPQDVGTPSGYLATLPSPIAADCLNYGLRFKRERSDVGLLLRQANGGPGELRAATGPRYGRVWQAEVLETLKRDLDPSWAVPGEFGKAVAITKANTTLYGSDRDMFVFLADEQNRIEIPGRRESATGSSLTGSLARGFFLTNSETGKSKLKLCAFYFDYVCCNRFVWGVEGFQEVDIRHTAGAPDRWLAEMQPALLEYANKGTAKLSDAIERARHAKIEEDLNTFLGSRFGARKVPALVAVHELEEGRPIETLWDAATAVTAYAKTVPWQDDRVELERAAGDLLDLAA